MNVIPYWKKAKSATIYPFYGKYELFCLKANNTQLKIALFKGYQTNIISYPYSELTIIFSRKKAPLKVTLFGNKATVEISSSKQITNPLW